MNKSHVPCLYQVSWDPPFSFPFLVHLLGSLVSKKEAYYVPDQVGGAGVSWQPTSENGKNKKYTFTLLGHWDFDGR